MELGTLLGLLGILLSLAVGVWQLYLRIRLVKWFVKLVLSYFRGA